MIKLKNFVHLRFHLLCSTVNTDIFPMYVYEMCTKFPVQIIVSLICVFIVAYWCSFLSIKNRKQKDELNKNSLYLEQRVQIDELRTAKQELTVRNALLSDKVIELEEKHEALVKKNRNFAQTVQDLENRLLIFPASQAAETIKVEPASHIKSKTPEELGFDALMERNFDAALAYFKAAIIKNPSNSNTYDYMGIAYANKGKYDEAIEACQNAIDCNCEDATAFYVMGLALQKLGYKDKAEECFQIKDIIRKN